MPHSTSTSSRQTVQLEAGPMASRDSGLHDGGETTSTTADEGYSLYREKTAELSSLAEESGDETAADAKSTRNERAMSPEEGKKRTQYFEDQFKDGHVESVRERLQKDSPVIADLRTNVIVKDEFTLVTDMSYHLSTRFSRPESAIMINVDHSACLLYAGSFEPAYVLTISALSSQIQPTTNKRNAALIQSFMADVLSVPPDRGVLRFIPIPEENLASNGVTVLGEIDRIEKQQAEENRQNPLRQSFTRGSRKSTMSTKRQTLKSDFTNTSLSQSISSPDLSSPPLPVPSSVLSSPSPRQPVQKSASEDKRKTIGGVLTTDSKPVSAVLKDGVAMSGRKSQTHTATPKPPPIPQDTPQLQRTGKRKSFLAVFRSR